jgi:hypothetical protein
MQQTPVARPAGMLQICGDKHWLLSVQQAPVPNVPKAMQTCGTPQLQKKPSQQGVSPPQVFPSPTQVPVGWQTPPFFAVDPVPVPPTQLPEQH